MSQAPAASLAEWLGIHAPGRSYIQLGGLGNPLLEHGQIALRAGAIRALQIETIPLPDSRWAPLRAACAEFGEAFSGLTLDPADGHAMLRQVPRADIVHVTQLFHERDPYVVLERLDRHARRFLAVTTMRMPVGPEGLAEDDAVPGFLPADPRMEAVRRLMAARGAVLEQFLRPPDLVLANGMAAWGGMWNWFMTEAVWRRLIGHFGWRVTHAFPSWGDLGITLLAER